MASKNFKIPARNNMIPANSTHPAPRFSTSPASLYAVKFPDLIPGHRHAAAGISQRSPRHSRGPLTAYSRGPSPSLLRSTYKRLCTDQKSPASPFSGDFADRVRPGACRRSSRAASEHRRGSAQAHARRESQTAGWLQRRVAQPPSRTSVRCAGPTRAGNVVCRRCRWTPATTPAAPRQRRSADCASVPPVLVAQAGFWLSSLRQSPRRARAARPPGCHQRVACYLRRG